MRRAGVNEIGSGNKISMQIVELTEQVTFLTTKNTPHREVCGVCSINVHGPNICSFKEEPLTSPNHDLVNKIKGY